MRRTIRRRGFVASAGGLVDQAPWSWWRFMAWRSWS
jgi:hypothetical protein